MKKLLLCAVLAVFGMISANAQEGFKVGINMGLPIGDASDNSSLELGADVAYLWELSDEFHLGATVGYGTFIAKEVHGYKPDNIGFMPIAATAQYSITESIFAGADLGYALVLSPSEVDGGLYYLPKVGYQNDLFEVYVGYKGFSAKTKGASVNIDIPGDPFPDGTDLGDIEVETEGSSSITMSAIVIGFNYRF